MPSTNTLHKAYSPAFYALYAFYARWFIFRSRGPLQKIDLYVRPQLPPGAADWDELFIFLCDMLLK